MRERVSLVLVAFLALCAGGGRTGVLPSQLYVSWAMAAETPARAPDTLPVRHVRRPARAPAPTGAYRVNYVVMARRSAIRAGIKRPERFVRQIAAESGYNPCAGSPAGAQGIAQIMPATAASWKVDPFNPQQALDVAARKMAVYERQLGSYELALAAYNAGPGAVQRYGGVPPYRETQNYIAKIMGRGDIWGLHNGVFTLPGHFTGTFNARLTALQRDVRRHGGRVVVTSGHRSYEHQVRLWREGKRKYGGWQAARKWIAPPGCSRHNLGTAADLSGDLALAHRLAAKHKLVFPMSHEPWHVQTV